MVNNTSNLEKSIITSNVKKNSKKAFQKFKDNFELSLLTIPALILFALFNYAPMFGVVLAFKNYRYDKGIMGSAWVGLKNFEFFFTSQDAFRITRNTVSYSLAFMVTGTIGTVLIALLLFEIMNNRKASKFYQTSMILPRFLSWVVVGFITYALLNPFQGLVNQLLQTIGVDPVQWYSHPVYWPFILIVVNLWNGVGMGSIIYYAGLMGADRGLYEAAEIDGAGKLKQAWHISIPTIVPLMVIQNILAFGGLFNGDFGLFYQIPRNIGGLYPATDIINTYVFRGLRSGNIGMTSAVGFFQSFVGLILIVAVNKIVKKISPDNSLF